MKKLVILLGVALLVLGLTMSVQAYTIEDTPHSGEVSLWKVLNNFLGQNFFTSNADLNAKLPYLVDDHQDDGCWKITYAAKYAGFSQHFGYADSVGGTFNSLGLSYAQGSANGEGAVGPIGFSVADDFNPANTIDNNGGNFVLYATDSGKGLLLDFEYYGFKGVYVAAFEDGAALDNTNFGDRDYNDLVVGMNACPAPIPGALWLLGSGLLGLVGLRRRCN
jgi:hypothetical protein